MKPRRQAAESQVGKVQLKRPLKTPKQKPGARLTHRSVKSDGLVEKNYVESERYQDPGPSNNRRRSRREPVSRSPVSNWNSSELDRQCFVAVKRLTPAEIEEMKQNLRKRRDNGRSPTQPEKQQKQCLPAPRQQSSKSGRCPRSSKSTTLKKDEATDFRPHSPQIAKSQTALTGENSPEPVTGIMQLPEEMLQHILGFVTFADLKSARLVSKHWRKMATTLLQRSSKHIRLYDTVFQCIAKIGPDGQFPVNRLEVQLYDDTERNGGLSYFRVFPAICSWVKELTLRVDMNVNSLSKTQSRLDMSSFPRDCTYQDLTHFNLRLAELTPRTPEFWKGFTDFVQSILKNSPHLREVTVNFWSCNSQKLPTSPVIEDIFPSSDSVGISKLSYINFGGVNLVKVDLAKWSTLNLKLRKLVITLSKSNDLNDQLTKFLETQSGTLKELNFNLIRCDSKSPAATFTFPRMEKLEQLGFANRFVSVILVNFPGVDYVKIFPCLKKLDLQQYENGIDWKDFLGNNLREPIITVEELSFYAKLGNNALAYPKPCPVISATRTFPGLRKLEINAHRGVIATVCENMPNLEVLIVNGYWKQLDDLITGLALEVCKTFEGEMTMTWIEKLKTTERQSMAHLQNLRTLKLPNFSYFSDRLISFSRLSFHVLTKMSSLKYLNLFDGKVKEIHPADEEVKQLLKELQARFVVL